MTEEEEETLPGLSCHVSLTQLPTIECFHIFYKLTFSARRNLTFVILVPCLRGEERAV